MKGIAIFSSCTFSCAALRSILTELYPDTETKEAVVPFDLIDTDTVIFILNECNLLHYSEFFLRYYTHIQHDKIILLGEKRNTLLFNAIACQEYKSIDVTLSTKKLTTEFSETISKRNFRQGDISKKNTITPCEIEVIRMLSAGQSLSEIAFIKSKSLKTISHYKYSFFRKLGLEDWLVTLLKITKGIDKAKASCDEPDPQDGREIQKFLRFFAAA